MKILVVLGTRPEAVKLGPVVRELRARAGLEVSVLHTRQHASMADSILDWFGISPEFEFGPIDHGGSLNRLLAHMLNSFAELLTAYGPDAIVVQGDTTTALAGALAGFHRQVPVCHVEAGLRTFDLSRPFPEEANRTLISRVATRHYCPTPGSAENLLNEGVKSSSIVLTGNTVVDAFYWTLNKVQPAGRSDDAPHVLVTAHRRESWGSGLDSVFDAIRELAKLFPQIRFVIPVHLNPIVRNAASSSLSQLPNVSLIEPLQYPEVVAMLDGSSLVITDSGGIQEEAVSIGVPTLVTRTETDRPEGINEGILQLVGTDTRLIVERASLILAGADSSPRHPSSVYGDGRASIRIADDIFSVNFAAI